MDLLENSAHCIDSYMGLDRALILQAINNLQQKRVWPYETMDSLCIDTEDGLGIPTHS